MLVWLNTQIKLFQDFIFSHISDFLPIMREVSFAWSSKKPLTIPVPIPDEGKKLTQILIFTLLYGASKGFMKDFKVFMKPFAVSQRSVKIKIQISFYFNASEMHRAEKINHFRIKYYYRRLTEF